MIISGFKTTQLSCCIDVPDTATAIDPLCFVVRGWVWLHSNQSRIETIEAWVDDRQIGSTAKLFPRADVAFALGLSPREPTGFELFAHDPKAPFGLPIALRIRTRLNNGEMIEIGRRVVSTIARDYRQTAYGNLLDRTTTDIHRRDTIFSSGPSLSHVAPDLIALLLRYLGPPPLKLVDVGCGVGAYGVKLRADGYDWFGVETKQEDCAELARLGLPHCRGDGNCLPFSDHAFDTALCFEVLEHIEDPLPFLRELRRVAPRLAVSVPNCELLSYLAPRRAVPWHMLEKDHKNYFTRWSLETLLQQVYEQVEVRLHTRYPLDTVEGTPLFYHLFAMASSPEG